jgi:hypothetical protein
MIVNIFKYQIPYIEYNLFKSYIAKNLCVKRSEKCNCCQGKCFLKKQVNLANENDNQPKTNGSNSHKTVNLEANEFLGADVAALKPYRKTRLLLPRSIIVHTWRIVIDVFVPPKKLFDSNSKVTGIYDEFIINA